MIKATDIAVVLSGGATNNDPNRSLGGEPSGRPLVSGLNTVFRDLTLAEGLQGRTDYRCFYFYNDHGQDTWADLTLWIAVNPPCCPVSLGVAQVDEVQQVRFGQATGGNVRIGFGETNFYLQWIADPTLMAEALQRGFRRMAGLSEVTCAAVGAGVFTVTYGGADGRRAQPLPTVISNNLIPSGTTCSTSRVASGAPMNTVSVKTTVETQIPFGVQFGPTSQNSPLAGGELRPGDRFPVWFRRVVPPNSPAASEASFTLRLNGGVRSQRPVIIYEFDATSQGGILTGGAAIANRRQNFTTVALPGAEPALGGESPWNGFININHYFYPVEPGEMDGIIAVEGGYSDLYLTAFTNEYYWDATGEIGGTTLAGTIEYQYKRPSTFVFCQSQPNYWGLPCLNLPVVYKLTTTGIKYSREVTNELVYSSLNGEFLLTYGEGSCGVWGFSAGGVTWSLRYVYDANPAFAQWALAGNAPSERASENTYWTTTAHPPDSAKWNCCGAPNVSSIEKWYETANFRLEADPEGEVCLNTYPNHYSYTMDPGQVPNGPRSLNIQSANYFINILQANKGTDSSGNPNCTITPQYSFPAQYTLTVANVVNGTCGTCASHLNGIFTLTMAAGSCDWTYYNSSNGDNWRLYTDLDSSGYVRWNLYGGTACGNLHSLNWGATSPGNIHISTCGVPGPIDAQTSLFTSDSGTCVVTSTTAKIKAVGPCYWFYSA